jgi:hypothetical protein
VGYIPRVAAFSATVILAPLVAITAAGLIAFVYTRYFSRRDVALDAFLKELDGVATGAEYSIRNRDDARGLDNLEQYIWVAKRELEAVRRTRRTATVATAERSLDAYAEGLRALREGGDAEAALKEAERERDAFAAAVRRPRLRRIVL